MKKLLVLLLVIALSCTFFASCDKLPDSVKEILDPILGVINPDDQPADEPTDDPADEPVDPNAPHVHSYAITESRDPTCSRPGKDTYTCSCGDSYTEERGEPLGHDYGIASITTPTCNNKGNTKYKCKTCGYAYTESTPATGHNFADFVEASRLIPCTNENCSYAKLAEGNGKYKEIFTFVFEEADVERFNTMIDEFAAFMDEAPLYDETLHAYEEGSETEAQYLIMEAKNDALYEMLEYVTAQYQIAQVEYHISMSEEKEANFDYISEVRTDFIAKFYSFSQQIYDSMYREYYYYGMTEQEIKEFIFESDAVSDPEYKALVDRNSEIELEFLGLSNPSTSELVPTLYAEFVANNNKIAKIMGYENYLAYAYENVYDRDYDYTDAAKIVENVKEYIVPVYSSVYARWNSITANLDSGAYAAYVTYIEESFFTNFDSNKTLNDYIDLLVLDSKPDKTISFSDELNNLMSDGNLFRGNYSGAYVSSLYGHDIPFAYFGRGAYSSAFTVAHEFGHYMNEVYSGGIYNQSFDLLEMHSQGNELIYLTYLKNLKGSEAINMELIETYQILVMLDTVVSTLSVDTFEQAVYTGTYSGTYSDEIMADGVITADEYDLLYKGIIKDFGADQYLTDTYWRLMTITSPCYYISYSVSALSVLPLYPMAHEDFDGAIDSYLKLFTYVDEYEKEGAVYMTTEETLEYAGLYSFTDSELYIMVSKFLKTLFS